MLNGNLKEEVKEFWDKASCGEIYASGQSEQEKYEAHRHTRYELEPYIISFAQFNQGGK